MQLQRSVGRSGRGTRSEPSLRRGGFRGLFLVAAYIALLVLPAVAPILGASAAVPPPVEFGVNETTAFMFALDGTFTDRKSTRLNSSHLVISYAVFCLQTNI